MADKNRVVLGVAISFAGLVWCAIVLFVSKMPRAQGFFYAAAAVVLYPIIYYRFWITFRGMAVWAKSTAGGKATLAGVHPDARMNLARM
jgi:hypothetical protein